MQSVATMPSVAITFRASARTLSAVSRTPLGIPVEPEENLTSAARSSQRALAWTPGLPEPPWAAARGKTSASSPRPGTVIVSVRSASSHCSIVEAALGSTRKHRGCTPSMRIFSSLARYRGDTSATMADTLTSPRNAGTNAGELGSESPTTSPSATPARSRARDNCSAVPNRFSNVISAWGIEMALRSPNGNAASRRERQSSVLCMVHLVWSGVRMGRLPAVSRAGGEGFRFCPLGPPGGPGTPRRDLHLGGRLRVEVHRVAEKRGSSSHPWWSCRWTRPAFQESPRSSCSTPSSRSREVSHSREGGGIAGVPSTGWTVSRT